jgi:hypothetical protein
MTTPITRRVVAPVWSCSYAVGYWAHCRSWRCVNSQCSNDGNKTDHVRTIPLPSIPIRLDHVHLSPASSYTVIKFDGGQDIVGTRRSGMRSLQIDAGQVA